MIYIYISRNLKEELAYFTDKHLWVLVICYVFKTVLSLKTKKKPCYFKNILMSTLTCHCTSGSSTLQYHELILQPSFNLTIKGCLVGEECLDHCVEV